MTEKELHNIIAIDESYRIERTVSISNMDKFQEAICAFANDLPGKRQKGYLLIGVDDSGKVSGLKVDDALMKRISGIRSDGNILTAFSVVVRDGHKTYEESISIVRQDNEISQSAASLNQLKPELKQHLILLIDSLYSESLAISELKHKPKLKPFIGDKSNAYIMKCLVRPAISHGWISMTYPENPRHPNQKYFLTDLGKGLLEWLRKE